MGSRYIVPNVTVSKYFQIGPEPIEIGSILVQSPTSDLHTNESVERTIETTGISSDTHPIGPINEQRKQLVNIKLLSSDIREGMNELPLKRTDLEISSTNVLPMSDHLLIHIHGGGFIATSSSTHEV
jgi:hypothetical protein